MTNSPPPRRSARPTRPGAGRAAPRLAGPACRLLPLALLVALIGLLLAYVPVPDASAQTTPQAAPIADVHVVPADWALKPSGLGAGDRFRLLFRTTSRWAATATDIATYDGYVQGELTKNANTLTAIQPYASGFKMVGSTQAANLRDHLDFRHGGNWRTGVPIYWMDDEGDGGLVANDYQDFCNEEQPWRSSIQPAEWWRAGTLADHRNENGAPHADSNHPWTGSENSCATRSSNYLGAARVEIGRHREPGRFYGPLSNTQAANTETRSMYAMSPEFIVAGPIHVSLSASDAVMTEGSSTDTATVEVSLSRSLVAGETITATFHSQSMFLGGDYTLALDGTPAGVTLDTTAWTITFSGAEAPRAVTLIGTAGANSVATSGTETKSLYFTGVSGIAGATYDGSKFPTALFIKSTSATGRSMTLTVSPERVAEGGTVTVTVDMSSTRSSAIIVQVNIPGLRSTHGVTTVTAVSGSVTQIWDNLNVRIAGNTTQARFTFVIPDDNNAEQAQPLTALFLDIADNNLQPGSAVQDWFTIEPSDHTAASPLVKVGLPDIEGISRNDYDQQVREENQSPLSFTITADPAPTANKDVCVDVVEIGGDRVSAANEGRRTVTILANSMTGTLSVPYTDTAVDEPDGAITARVVGGTGCTGYTVSTEEPIDEALIKDGEATLVSLTSDDTRMTEGDAADTAVAKLALSRPLMAREMIEVRLTLTTATGARLPGHATPDFAVAAQGTGVTVEGLTSAEPKLFFTGSGSKTVQEATITITPVSGLDDGDTGHEIITMALVSDSVLSGRGLATTVSGGVGRGSDFSQQLVLTDDEGGALPTLTVSVVGGHGHIAEGGTRRLRIQSDQAALPGGIAIANLASGSSYSSGYAGAVPSSATIPSGSTSVDFDISVTDNSADAAYGTLTWTLPMNDAVYSRGDPHSVSLVIADDEIGASIPKPEVYEFPYLKWHLPSFYYLPRAKILADGRRTVTAYEDPSTRKADGSINTDDYYWHRDLYVLHDPNRNNPMYYYFWFHPGYQPTGPVTLTVKAVDHQNNANAETGRVAFALDLDLTAPPYGENGPFTNDELTVTLNPEDLVRHSGGAVHFRPGFAIYVNPRVYNECVDITHTLSGGGYGSVTVETMRVHLSPQGEMGPTDRTNTACGSPGLLDSELRTTGRQGGYAWTSLAIDMTGSSDAPVQPPTVRLAVGQYWTAQRDGESGNPIREGQYATFTVRYIGDIYEPVTVKYTVSQTGDVIDTARFNPNIQHSVTIPASSYFSGAVSFDIPTKGDNVTEPDGSITAMLVADSAYISTANPITVQVTDGGGRVGMNSPPQPPQPDTNGRPQIQGGPGDENGNPVGPIGSNAPPSDAIGSNAPPSTDSDGSDALGSGGSSTPTPKPAGWPHGLAQLVEGGDSEIIAISLAGGALGENQEVVATLRSSGATPLDDYTLTLDSASSPGVSVSRDHPLNAAESRITFGPGAERAVLMLRAIGDDVDEYERLTLTVTGTVYFDGSDTTNIPVNRSLEFAIMDSAAPDAELAEAERLILAMIERHRNVTGNARALANWEKALKTILGQEGGFTIEELEAHAASVRAGKPTERWALVLKVAKKLDALRRQQAQQATPEVSVAAGSGITEGGSASFTVTASPAPARALSVNVAVTQSGDYGVSTGTATVTIPTSGSITHTVATLDDGADEADGSVTLSVNAGDGYTVSSTQGAATVNVSDDDVPEVSVAAGGGITEGGSASFTVTASPAPASPLSVSLTVSETGDYAASGTTGARTVTIPTSGSVSHAVATVNDDVDEADGSVTFTVNAGQGYTVSSTSGAATVAVADDDTSVTPENCVTTDAGLLALVEAKTRDPWKGTRSDLLEMFTRSYNTMKGTDTYTTADIKARTDKQDANWQGDGPNPLWQKVYAELDLLETCRGADQKTPPPPPPDPDPEISVTAGSGVTEGGAATFTVTADPAPSAPLTVTVTVTQQGDYAASGATGAQTVTIPTTGSAQPEVATVNDALDEADGSITVTLNTGQGYTVSSSQNAASVAVSDDDTPPPPPPPDPPPPTDPEPDTDVTEDPPSTQGAPTLSVHDASGDEGWELVFRVTLSQASDQDVKVRWTTHPYQGLHGRARSGADYLSGWGTIKIPAGNTVWEGTILLEQDDQPEGDEHFEVWLSHAEGATIADGTGVMTIIDDD